MRSVYSVHHTGENTARYELDKANFDCIYIEKASKKNTYRPELKATLDYAREGDVMGAKSYSCIARSPQDSFSIVSQLMEKGADFVSQMEKIDTSSSSDRLILTIFDGLTQFERECLFERQVEGIAIAKLESCKVRPKIQPCADFAAIVRDWKDRKTTAVEVMKRTRMTKAIFCSKIKALHVG